MLHHEKDLHHEFTMKTDDFTVQNITMLSNKLARENLLNSFTNFG